MVHIDLCGPAYDLFTYRRRPGTGCADSQGVEDDEEVPVYMVESRAVVILPLHPVVAEQFPHKLQMSRLFDQPGCQRSARTPENRVECGLGHGHNRPRDFVRHQNPT